MVCVRFVESTDAAVFAFTHARAAEPTGSNYRISPNLSIMSEIRLISDTNFGTQINVHSLRKLINEHPIVLIRAVRVYQDKYGKPKMLSKLDIRCMTHPIAVGPELSTSVQC